MSISDLVVKAAEEHGPLKAELESVEKQLTDVTERYEATEDDAEQEALIEELDSLQKQKAELMPRVEKARRKLEVLRDREREQATSAKPVATQKAPAVISDIRKGNPGNDYKPGDFLVRAALVKGIAKITNRSEAEVLEERYGDDINVKSAFAWSQKSAVAPADTLTAGFAAELVETDIRGFLDMISNVSVGAALAGRSMQLSFGGANAVTVPRMNQISAAGLTEPAWVGEGGVIPLTNFSFGSTTLNRYKLASIVPMTMELARTATRDAEAIMRRGMQEQYALMLDSAILSATAAAAGVRPAGLLNGVTVGTADATGGYESVLADMRTLMSALTAAGLGQSPVLILNDEDFIALGMLTNPLGQMPFREAVSTGSLMGVPIIHSRNATKGTVIMVEASALATAFDGPEFSASEQATLTLANANGTAPTQAIDGSGDVATAGQVGTGLGISVNGGATGLGTAGFEARNLFQTWSMAIRGIWPTSWAVMRPGAVAALDTLAW